jgi:hypothetical protein
MPLRHAIICHAADAIATPPLLADYIDAADFIIPTPTFHDHHAIISILYIIIIISYYY